MALGFLYSKPRVRQPTTPPARRDGRACPWRTMYAACGGAPSSRMRVWSGKTQKRTLRASNSHWSRSSGTTSPLMLRCAIEWRSRGERRGESRHRRLRADGVLGTRIDTQRALHRPLVRRARCAGARIAGSGEVSAPAGLRSEGTLRSARCQPVCAPRALCSSRQLRLLGSWVGERASAPHECTQHASDGTTQPESRWLGAPLAIDRGAKHTHCQWPGPE